jgi:hypothetical protein
MPPKKFYRMKMSPGYGANVYGPGTKVRPVMMGGAKRTMLHHPQHGYGFFDSIGNFFKKTLPAAARSVGNFVKDHKILSTVAGYIPHPAASLASAVLRQVGLGRGRRKVTASRSSKLSF